MNAKDWTNCAHCWTGCSIISATVINTLLILLFCCFFSLLFISFFLRGRAPIRLFGLFVFLIRCRSLALRAQSHMCFARICVQNFKIHTLSRTILFRVVVSFPSLSVSHVRCVAIALFIYDHSNQTVCQLSAVDRNYYYAHNSTSSPTRHAKLYRWLFDLSVVLNTWKTFKLLADLIETTYFYRIVFSTI